MNRTLSSWKPNLDTLQSVFYFRIGRSKRQHAIRFTRWASINHVKDIPIHLLIEISCQEKGKKIAALKKSTDFLKNITTAKTAKSGNFDVANSSCQFLLEIWQIPRNYG